jgi:PAS domain S-box-containing protein
VDSVEVLLVLGISILLQLAAAFLAVRLIRVTGSRMPWILIAASVALMALRRGITFARLISRDLAYPPDPLAELVAFATSTIMLVGIAFVAPLFRSIRRSEDALRESEEKYRLLAETAMDIIFAHDMYGRIIYANRAGQEISGYGEEELLRMNIADVIPAEYLASMAERRAGRSSGDRGVCLYQAEFVDRAGQHIPVEVSSSPLVRQDELFGMVIVARDITDREQVDKELRQRNRELALLNRAGQALTSTLDLDQVLATVLEEVRRLLDVTASSVWLVELETGELICRQATGPGSDVVRGWRLAPGEGIAGWVAGSGESLIVSDTQSDERHFKGVDQQVGLEMRSILSVPLRVKKDVIGVLQVLDIAVNRFDAADVTLLRLLAASAAVAIDNARLVEAMRQYTDELKVRNEELDAFVHTVAHDLKDPLALVVGLAEVLREEYPTLSDRELCRYLRKVAQSGRKMSNIIDELMLLAGVRKIEVEMRPLDMGNIVAEAMQRLADMIEEHQAEIISPETWPVAWGYGPWVEEVWVNYLSNALKYGGRPPRVELGATAQSNGAVRFWVRDNGPGLTPEEQARLFTPFTRLEQVCVKGHGLGLSIVRRIVEKLDGQVGVESEVGQGSVFSFTLPGAAD